jgi:spore coat protein U-like protein
MKMRKLLLLLSIIGISIFFANTLYAVDTTTQMQVSANVVGTCSVNVTDLDFGDISGNLTIVNGQGDITVTCSNGTQYEIILSSGLYWDGSSRNMRNPPDDVNVPYDLYSDAGLTTPWGNYSDNEFGGVSDTGSGSAQSHTVYGEARNSNNAPPGAFSDTVEVTVSY